jgi:hypothetical protein
MVIKKQTAAMMIISIDTNKYLTITVSKNLKSVTRLIGVLIVGHEPHCK